MVGAEGADRCCWVMDEEAVLIARWEELQKANDLKQRQQVWQENSAVLCAVTVSQLVSCMDPAGVSNWSLVPCPCSCWFSLRPVLASHKSLHASACGIRGLTAGWLLARCVAVVRKRMGLPLQAARWALVVPPLPG